MSWSEASLHAWLARTAPTRVAGVAGRLGSDAITFAPSAERWVVCVDQTIEGVHYASDVSPGRAGAKAVARAISDLAASAARPRAVLLALSLPRTADERAIRAGITGLRKRARALGAELVGGDLAAGGQAWHWSVTALGLADAQLPTVGRTHARVGDVLLVTGPLGGAQLGRHLRLEPRIEEGRWLHTHGARAMMDTSDGAAIDLERLAAASNVGFELEALPIHRDARRAAKQSGRPVWEHALTDGEDHELIATLPRQTWAKLEARARRRFPALHVLGRAVSEPGAWFTTPDGTRRRLADFGGWVHG